MHKSPEPKEKYLFLNQDRLRLYTFGLVSTLCVVAGNLFFIYAFPFFAPYVIVTGITIFYLSLSYLVGFSGKEFDFKFHRHLTGKWFDRAADASVDIYLPVCREPTHVIFNTWEHVERLKQYHPNVKIYVLDDGKDDVVRDQAEKMGFEYIRRESNELKKAGNLRNAFAQTKGEFFAIFDADFCPANDFLFNTIPYFHEDLNTAIVQTPQFFDVSEQYSWVRNGAGAVQELFYRLIQVNRNTFGGAICVGTNAVYRRDHLEPFGGTAAIPYSEDVHTGFQLISNGHRVVYIPINLCLGACPDTIKQFFTQQYRWSLGSISLLLSMKFWQAKISIMQRICYMTGMFYYISTGVSSVTYFLPGILILTVFPEHMHWYNLLFSVPSLLFSVFFMKSWMKMPMTVDVLRTRAVSYFAHLYALRDKLFNTLEEWKPTGAQFKSDRYESASALFSAIAYLIPMFTAIMIGWRIYQGYAPENFILLTLFTAFNAWVMIPVTKDL